MHILAQVTDNFPSWISARERMTVEKISWAISAKECCRTGASNSHSPHHQSRNAICIAMSSFSSLVLCPPAPPCPALPRIPRTHIRGERRRIVFGLNPSDVDFRVGVNMIQGCMHDTKYSEIPLLRPPKIKTFYLLKTLFWKFKLFFSSFSTSTVHLNRDHLWDCTKVVFKTTFGQSQRWS